MAYSEEELEEIQKLQKLIKQYEGLIRISKNVEQLTRTKRELKKIKDRLEILCPDGIPDNLVANSTSSASASSHRSPDEILNSKPALQDFSFEKACTQCDDTDVNLLHTVLKIWEEEFIPALGAHVKLEFSLANERDAHYANLENIKRQLKILIDTSEDYVNSTNEDMKTQLREMKQRYTRHYLQEGYNFLKKIKEFWQQINEDAQSGGTLCMNKTEPILFNKQFETATYLHGVSATEAILKGYSFVNDAIEILNVPSLPKK